MSKQQIDILAINETKLDSNIPMDLISLEGYNWVSMNRNRFGGGVGFYIGSTIDFRIRPDLNTQGIELLSIEISTKQNHFYSLHGIVHPILPLTCLISLKTLCD